MPDYRITSGKATPSLDDQLREQITQQNQQNSPLLRLPPELRNKIYGFLAETATYKLARTQHSDWSVQYGIGSLRLVCRQLDSEAYLFQGPPKILELKGKSFGQELLWLINKGRAVELTTIDVYPHTCGCVRAILREISSQEQWVAMMFEAQGTGSGQPYDTKVIWGPTAQRIHRTLPDLRCVRVHDFTGTTEARLKMGQKWRDVFFRPELEVLFV